MDSITPNGGYIEAQRPEGRTAPDRQMRQIIGMGTIGLRNNSSEGVPHVPPRPKIGLPVVEPIPAWPREYRFQM